VVVLQVTYVGFSEAQAYCKSLGRRLPTEIEWQYAAQVRAAWDNRGPPLLSSNLSFETWQPMTCQDRLGTSRQGADVTRAGLCRGIVPVRMARRCSTRGATKTT
jgi:hypothetical protein